MACAVPEEAVSEGSWRKLAELARGTVASHTEQVSAA